MSHFAISAFLPLEGNNMPEIMVHIFVFLIGFIAGVFVLAYSHIGLVVLDHCFCFVPLLN